MTSKTRLCKYYFLAVIFLLFIITFLMCAIKDSLAYKSDIEKQTELIENIIINGGFENLTQMWSASWASTSSTFTAQTSTVGRGTYALQWDAHWYGDYVECDLSTQPSMIKSQQCFAEFWYKGADANISFYVIDTNGSQVSSAALSTASDWTRVHKAFTCPATASLKVRFKAFTDSAIMYIDNVHVWESSNISAYPIHVDDIVNTRVAQAQITSAYISNSGTPTVSSQDGTWIDSITDNEAGDITLNVTSGTFSTAPNCTVTPIMDEDHGRAQVYAGLYTVSTSAIRILSNTEDENSATGVGGGHVTKSDEDLFIICIGAK